MDIAAYCDGITDLLKEAGVTENEIEERQTRMYLSHCFVNGVPFEDAALHACHRHNVEIREEA